MPARSNSSDAPVLSTRALNRALLARQLLLRRSTMVAAEAIEHLVGVQAQEPFTAYTGLWSRLNGFQPEHLARLLRERDAVRLPLFRATIHLVSAADALALRPVVDPVLVRGFHSASPFGKQLKGMDLEPLLQAGRALIEEQPRTRAELSQLLAERWPERDAASLAQAVTYLLPVVQATPRGIWGERGPARWTTVESWLGRSVAGEQAPDAMLRRYLAAFGPASVQDARAWSGLPGLGEVFERLRPELISFRDEAGRELFDLPDAPRPDPETPAPPRFLPEFDNLVLGHADRSRVVPEPYRRLALSNLGTPTAIVDGFARATWSLARTKTEATLRITPLEPLSAAEQDGLVAEGSDLLAFLAPEAATREVRLTDQR